MKSNSVHTRYIRSLAVWIAALPAAIIVNFVAHALAQPDGNSTILNICNIISILGGIWFMIGWIPVVIFASKDKKEKGF